MENPGHLIIGAECGIKVGTGHVMRCLALAQAWKRSGGSVTFLLPEGSPGIEERIRLEGFCLLLLPEPPDRFTQAAVEQVIRSKPRVVVLDGYNFRTEEQVALSHAAIPVLAIDDYRHAVDYPTQWVLNQNAYAQVEMYPRRSAGTRLLLGPTYALLRDEFLSWIGWRRSVPEKASRVLVTIGGSDPGNASERVLESLATLQDPTLEVVLIIGGSNPHIQAVQAAAERLPIRFRIIQNTLEMPSLMAWADIAIAGAGVTSYELCYMGLPAVLLVVAENQRRIAASLSDREVAVDAGATKESGGQQFAGQLRGLIESRERREAMSDRARALVDGLGADRVRAALLDRDLRLRHLCKADCELLFSWANESAARAASFQSGEISWEEHARWFAQHIEDRQSVIYIGENLAGEPVGQVRFHIEGEKAILSIIVAPKFRGAGWGKELIAFSVRSLARKRAVTRVDAFVKPNNQPSIRLFESAGFLRASDREEVDGQEALLFTWELGKAVHVQ